MKEIYVYGEDLVSSAPLTTASTAGQVYPYARGTQGGLGVVLVAVGDVTIKAAKSVTATITGGETSSSLATAVVTRVHTAGETDETYEDGDVIENISLPEPLGVKLLKGVVASDDTTNNAGKVRLTLRYIPR